MAFERRRRLLLAAENLWREKPAWRRQRGNNRKNDEKASGGIEADLLYPVRSLLYQYGSVQRPAWAEM